MNDELWASIASEIPPELPKPTRGRLRVPYRAALTGSLFVLQTGIQRNDWGAGTGW